MRSQQMVLQFEALCLKLQLVCICNVDMNEEHCMLPEQCFNVGAK